MRLIKPSTKIEFITDPRLIELFGRVAHKSEKSITDTSYLGFIEMIKKLGHWSVLEHSMMSVRFIINRGVSHELVRHRPTSPTQESSRFCNYIKQRFGKQITYIIPLKLYDSVYEGSFDHHDMGQDHSSPRAIWLYSMLNDEFNYFRLIEAGWKAEDARGILPNDLKTEVIVTANFREWRHIFAMRTVKAAHPQMREVMIPLLAEVQEKIPVVFTNIEVEK